MASEYTTKDLGRWAEVASDAVLKSALALARGTYQRNLILGYENLSGSTLKGFASSYGGHYAESRRNLLDRLETNGIKVQEKTGPRGARILVLG